MNKTAKPFTGLCTRSLFCYSHTHSHTCTHANTNTNTNTNTNRRYASQVLLCSGLFCDPNGCCTLLATMVAAAQAARRRRERRLRAYLRYAWMSVAMALAECQHHSAQRQRTARPGRRIVMCTTRRRSGRQMILPSRSSSTSSRNLAVRGLSS